MKLLFFLVALFLILLRGYFAVMNHGAHRGDDNGTMTIGIGDYQARIKWSGKVVLSEDESSIVSMAPGGYLRFNENDAKMVAESNIKGEISYQLYDGNNDLVLNDSGKHFISACIRKMIGWGYYAAGRAERINKRGGYKSLIAELPNLKMQNIKVPYLQLLFSNDSLDKASLSAVIRQTAGSVTDIDKENFLKSITPEQRKDSMVSDACLEIIESMNADIQKVNLLSLFIEKDSLTNTLFARMVDITEHLHADMDKITIYRKLADRSDLTEQQFITLINAVMGLHADIDKSNTLIYFAQKMPRTENTRAAYLVAAKKINNDADYGRAVKIIE